jgi:hypothetical protein
MNIFIRFAETIKLKADKRVVSVTVTPTITDCTGTIYFTDIQFQEGEKLTATSRTPERCSFIPATPHATKRRGQGRRNSRTVQHGRNHSAGLDVYIYPKQLMAAGSIEVSQGMGSHKCTFTAAASAGDEFALKASNPRVLAKR